MNLNKAAIHELYHFRTPEDIAHMITNANIMMVCDCKKGYWHQELDEASSFLTTFNTKFGRFYYTVMPFGITITVDVFQWKLDQCFSHLKNVIVIADDIMVIGKNQREHNLALTTLLDTARQYNKTMEDHLGHLKQIFHKLRNTELSIKLRKCHFVPVRLNYNRLQYKKTEVDLFGETYMIGGCKPYTKQGIHDKYNARTKLQERSSIIYRDD